MTARRFCDWEKQPDGSILCPACGATRPPGRPAPLRRCSSRRRRSDVDRLLDACRRRRRTVGPAIVGRDDAWLLAILADCRTCPHWQTAGGCARFPAGCAGRNALAAVLVAGLCPHAPTPPAWEHPPA